MKTEFENAVSGHLDWLKTDIERTNFTNWKLLYKNAEAHVRNMLALIEITPDIEAASHLAVQQSRKFANLAQDMLLSTEAADTARSDALSAVEALREATRYAKPNAGSRALGY